MPNEQQGTNASAKQSEIEWDNSRIRAAVDVLTEEQVRTALIEIATVYHRRTWVATAKVIVIMRIMHELFGAPAGV